jgi:murein DD-endopeptidase MepM/ murein hydrolase activator NlpD
LTAVIKIHKYLFPILLALLLTATQAESIQIEVSPGDLSPGDAFLIRVSGVTCADDIKASMLDLDIGLTSCGDDCLFGIGVIPPDTNPGIKIVNVDTTDQQSEVSLLVKTSHPREIHLRLPDNKVEFSPEDLLRIKEEENRLKAFWIVRTERLFQGSFIMPLPNPVLTGFGVKRIINKKNVSVHRGIDLKGGLGEKVGASNRGRVVLAEELFFGGNTIVLDHGLGIYTVYMHLDRFNVKPGDLVAKGEIIGLVGSTGRSTGPHLHFGLKILTFNSNPLSIMQLIIK